MAASRAEDRRVERFDSVRLGRLKLVVAASERDWLLPLLQQAPAGFPGSRTIAYEGGRGATRRVETGAHTVVVRASLRGGLPGWFWSTTYLGFAPRVIDELAVTSFLRERQVSVPRPMGAVVQWHAPGLYRSWLATEVVPQARSVIQWLEQTPAPELREILAMALGTEVRRMHAAGVSHPDLNLHNILVCGTELPRVTLIDFDRARRSDRPIEDVAGVRSRLLRSAARLDPGGRAVGSDFIEAVASAYESTPL